MKIISLANNYGRCVGGAAGIRIISDSAMLKDSKPFYLPEFAPCFRARASLAVRIDRLGKNIAPRFAHRYYCEAAAALNIETSGMEGSCAEGWSFDGAAVVGTFMPIEKYGIPANFSIECGDDRQVWNSSELRLSIDDAIAEVSRYFTLKTGDLIFLGLSDHYIDLKIGKTIIGTTPDGSMSLTLNIK